MKYLVLPDIRSTHNVGAFFRTADAFGFDKIYLCGITPQPPRADIAKVSLGAETWIPFEYHPNVVTLLRRLQAQETQVISLEYTSASIPIQNVSSIDSPHVALVVGNEVYGVHEDVLALSDLVVHIPMVGKKESLNVSVAGGIAMHWLSGLI